MWWLMAIAAGVLLAASAGGAGSVDIQRPVVLPGVSYPGGAYGAQRAHGVHRGLDIWQADHGWASPIIAVLPGIISLVVDEVGFLRRGGRLAESGTLTRGGRQYHAISRVDSRILHLSNLDNSDYSTGHMGLTVWIDSRVPDSSEVIRVRYMHLSGVSVVDGQRVEAGQKIGFLGCTDVFRDGPHLHVDVQVDGAFVDPARIGVMI